MLAGLGLAPTSEDVERLAQYVEIRTVTSVGADPEGRLALSAHPGYLATSSGADTILVPFQLAPVFPGRAVLDATVAVARDARVVEGNPICVSGSATFLGRTSEVGDLDFCEYHLGDPGDLPGAVARKAAEDAPLALIELKCGDRAFKAPWDDVGEVASAILDVPPPLPAGRVKLDMWSDGPLGPLPATCLVLALGEDREAGNAEWSFAHQEAVLTDGPPPRVLDDPLRFSRYCGWLLAEARRLVSGEGVDKPATVRAPKALKRLLSLLLAFGDAETVEEVLAGLDADHVRQIVRSGRLAELEGMAGKADPALRKRLEARLASLRTELGSGRLSDEQVGEAADITLRIAQDVIEEVEGRLAAVGGAR